MLALTANTKIMLATKPVDMRKGANSLAYFIQSEFNLDPRKDYLFVFFSRKSDRVKVIYWDRNGFALWYKILANGKFRLPRAHNDRIRISGSDLNLILEGLDLTNYQRLQAM